MIDQDPGLSGQGDYQRASSDQFANPANRAKSIIGKRFIGKHKFWSFLLLNLISSIPLDKYYSKEGRLSMANAILTATTDAGTMRTISGNTSQLKQVNVGETPNYRI